MSIEGKRLTRDTKNGKIGGVCSGLGKYLNIDPTALRIIFLIALFVLGSGFLAYMIMWICMPSD